MTRVIAPGFDGDAVALALSERDGNRCSLCGYPALGADPFRVEHLRSRADGGTDELSNLRLVHRSCGRRRDNR